METRVVKLKSAEEGYRFLKHQISGDISDILGSLSDISNIIKRVAETNPEILNETPHIKSALNLSDLLDIAESSGNRIVKKLNEVK